MNRTQNQNIGQMISKIKLYWENQPKKHSLQIRNKNIRLLDSVLKKLMYFTLKEIRTQYTGMVH